MYIRAWKTINYIEIVPGDNPNYAKGEYLRLLADEIPNLIKTLQEVQEFRAENQDYKSFKVGE